MNKNFLKIIAAFLSMVLFFATLPITTMAATTTKYETIKDNVPIWSEASSKSTQVRRIAEEGTILEVTSSKINVYGNRWYKLSDGNWVYSGNVKKHSHKGVLCGRATYAYSKLNETAHKKTTTMPDLCSCGYEVGTQTSTREEAHAFDGNGQCTKCGFQAHVHKGVACGQVRYEYNRKDETVHTITSKEATLCSCGAILGYNSSTSEGAHSFNASNICTLCGETKGHIHKLDQLKRAGSEYMMQDTQTHVFKEEVLELCSCGSTINKRTLQTTQRHQIGINGKCVCGYREGTTDHTHKGIMSGDPFVDYVSRNQDTHYVLEKNPNLCGCGTVVTYDSLVLSEEAHRFENGVCQKCNEQKNIDFFDVDATQIVDQVVTGNYSDTVTVAGTIAQAIVGEIPIIGTIADVRDVIADIQNDAGFVETALDMAALVPVVGLIKFSDEAVDVAQDANKIVETKFFEKGTQQAIKYSEGVKFTLGPNGKTYPRFEKWAIAKAKFDTPTPDAVKNEKALTGIYKIDQVLANKQTGFPKTPDGYVWHHVEDMQTMLLIPQDLHSNARYGGMWHIGGASLIRKHLKTFDD